MECAAKGAARRAALAQPGENRRSRPAQAVVPSATRQTANAAVWRRIGPDPGRSEARQRAIAVSRWRLPPHSHTLFYRQPTTLQLFLTTTRPLARGISSRAAR